MSLEALYKEHVAHSHLKALEMVFQAGVEHALERTVDRAIDVNIGLMSELSELKVRFAALQDQHIALQAQVAQLPPAEGARAEDAQKAAEQALQMGTKLMDADAQKQQNQNPPLQSNDQHA